MNIPITVGQYPEGLCPTTYQALANALGAIFSVNINATSGVNLIVSSSRPDPANQGVSVWLRLDAIGRPTNLYWFAQGAWLSLHSMVPGFIMVWPFSLPDFTTFDGGDANAISDISGPMWQLANTALDGSGTQVLAAQVALGVGTLASGKVLAVGDTGGEENHTLLVPELPPHSHALGNNDSVWNSALGSGSRKYLAQRGNSGNSDSDDYELQGTATTPSIGASGNTGGGSDGTTTPHNTLPPYTAVYFLQRTKRLYYAVL